MVTVQLAQRRGAGIVFRLFRARCQEAPTLTEPVTDAHGSQLRSEVNSELNFPPNFEGLVLGCIDADFCK